ncbi:ABC transporter permease [Actinomadura livida]|uniref:Transport permease protein n=1 Tax=Actinomadura livida TaxID=79909 RepID=A0A7W7IJE5_9ACTN|nr:MULTISPECIES: ABC transporter permease [Actinomadura]MBB4778095.1 ABC-2 type transport system permease protein [Actinomadura catellatispora]GGU28757.1 transport permease protein [Actinomadura livida]
MTTTPRTAISTVTPAPPHPPARGAGLLVGLRVFTARSLKHSFRDGESLLMAILLPVLLMLIFTYVLGGAMDVGEGGDAAGAREAYLAFVLPAVALIAAGFGASYTSVVVSNDMTTGFMNRLRTMPFPSVTVLLGHAASSMVRNLLATAVVLLVGFAVGFRTDASVPQFLGAVGIIAVWILVITCVFAMLGMVAGSAEAATGYGFILLFLPYISSGFARVETMPAWLRPIAEHQPMTPVIDSSRALLNGRAPGSELWVGMLWCAGLMLLAVWLIAVIFPRKVART